MYNYTADREQMLNREMYYIWVEVREYEINATRAAKQGYGVASGWAGTGAVEWHTLRAFTAFGRQPKCAVPG